jgi:hypothetical protein
MRRPLPDRVTPQGLVMEMPDQQRSVEISSGGQKSGQKFSFGERTLAQPTASSFGPIDLMRGDAGSARLIGVRLFWTRLLLASQTEVVEEASDGRRRGNEADSGDLRGRWANHDVRLVPAGRDRRRMVPRPTRSPYRDPRALHAVAFDMPYLRDARGQPASVDRVAALARFRLPASRR